MCRDCDEAAAGAAAAQDGGWAGGVRRVSSPSPAEILGFWYAFYSLVRSSSLYPYRVILIWFCLLPANTSAYFMLVLFFLLVLELIITGDFH